MESQLLRLEASYDAIAASIFFKLKSCNIHWICFTGGFILVFGDCLLCIFYGSKGVLSRLFPSLVTITVQIHYSVHVL